MLAIGTELKHVFRARRFSFSELKQNMDGAAGAHSGVSLTKRFHSSSNSRLGRKPSRNSGFIGKTKSGA
ncbi:uncharacterized [Tachysurus ichikawai]